MRVYNYLKTGLDAANLRNKVIANNIANVNTKGYKKYSVSFEDTFKKATESLELLTNNDRHIKESPQKGDIEIKQDINSSMREDGNNVDVDKEMADSAANSLMYYALVNQINSKYSSEKYIINGGK
jgi:flagellar basal-body rod protein FlgB